jgi:phosphohistidine phosphatase
VTRTLYLLRNGGAGPEVSGPGDLARPLGETGCRKLRVMAASGVFATLAGVPGWCSPALRARQSVDELLRLGALSSDALVDERLYVFSGYGLLSWLSTLPGDEPALLIVGHNPALGELVSILTAMPLAEFPAGSLACLRLRVNNWQSICAGVGSLNSMVPPHWASYGYFGERFPTLPGSDRSLPGQIAFARSLAGPASLDLDPEFVHQYRTNHRKLLSLVRSASDKVGESGRSSELRGFLRQQLKLTNDIRDLDVMLLAVADWHHAEAGVDGLVLQRLSGYLAGLRENHLRHFRQYLASDTYQAGFESAWRAAVGLRGQEPARGSEVTAVQVHGRTDKLVAAHRRLHEGSSDREMHRFRIKLKKLRYRLHKHREEERELVAQLARLQDLLGDYQDCAVQQRYLQSCLEEEAGDAELADGLRPVFQLLADRKAALKRQVLDWRLQAAPDATLAG